MTANPYKRGPPASNPYSKSGGQPKAEKRGKLDDEEPDEPEELENPDEWEESLEDDVDLHELQLPPEEEEEGQTSPSTIAAKWQRPEVAPFKPKDKALIFQWVDLDTTVGPVLVNDPKTGRKAENQVTESRAPMIRLYGITEEGHSIFVHVHGYVPYLFIPAPEGFRDEHREALRLALNSALRGQMRGGDKNMKDPCQGVTWERNKQSIFGYHFGQTRDFLKIYVAAPTLVPKVKAIFHAGAVNTQGFGMVHAPTVFESNVPFVLRFMVDTEMQGASWAELPAASYSLRADKDQVSRCQIEADIYYQHIVCHPCEGEWMKMAPLRIISFDIECSGRKGHFPEAKVDPVIQIASSVKVQGQEGLIAKNVFTLGGCSLIPGAHVVPSETEEEMLLRWSAFLRAVDPDILTGYNIQNFDVPYLLNRAEALSQGKNGSKKVKRFWEWGRLRHSMCRMKDTTFQSSAHGKRESVETTVHGRVMFDMLTYMTRNEKLSSYSLNSVSAHFLGQQKEDVHYSIISDLQRGSDEDRRRLAVYCIKLMEKLSVLVNYVEMARVTGVPLNFLLQRGQQIKVFSMLLRKCKSVGLLIPNLPKTGGNAETYEGATVLEPKRAFYKEPVATLDFASLYPSIMQAYNLCYSTLVAPCDMGKLKEGMAAKSPSNDMFIKASVQKGILPVILDELLSARKRAKKDMKAATDPMIKAVQNGRQLALKISANSVYGFTGATVGQLPCLPIASSTTSYGRELLFQTRTFVEEHYTKANGFPADAEVVYGDTDSVMVKFGVTDMAEQMKLAEQAAKEISARFPRPIMLEFEKVYYPYLLMNKKRYAGLMWTRPEKYDKMDTKGLETVRRDNCLLVRKVIDMVLKKMLIEKDEQGAIDYSKMVISQLLQNKMDISLLVITKSLGKSADAADYTAKQAHVELARRLKIRDPGNAPQVGDRVPYVIIEKIKNAPMYEKSEDPVYVLEHNLPIDTKYYLENQLLKPLCRLFEPILENPMGKLQHGEHTRAVVKKAPTTGGIMTFAVKKSKCMGCKTPISSKEDTLCVHCRPRAAEFYTKKLQEVNDQQLLFHRLWTNCQDCQGSCHSDVLCSNQDCPIFYKRKKVQIDLKEAREALDKFAW